MRRGAFRWLAVAAGVGLGASGALALVSCVLVDPPVEPVTPPQRRPTILHDGVQPPVSKPLLELPAGGFLAQVELSDPALTFEWEVFVDYDRPSLSNLTQTAVLRRTVVGSSDNPDIQVVSFALDPETYAAGCHTIQLMVALRFLSDHQADPATGSDSVTWFYTPNGDVAACSAYDGGSVGADGAFPPDAVADAAPDASIDAAPPEPEREPEAGPDGGD